MRLFALTAVASLAVLVALSQEKVPAAGKSTPRPYYYAGSPVYIPRLPSGYRPNGNNRGRVVNVNTSVTFTFNTDVGMVRTYDPPASFDDKGNVKKYTREELKKLKGDTPQEKKAVGYKSEFADIHVGDVVQVTLSAFKSSTPAKPAGKKNLKIKEEEKDKDKEEKEDKVAVKEKKDGKWVAAAQFLGKVTQVENSGSESSGKITVQITSQTVVYGNARTPSGKQTVDPEKAQGTLIVITRRAPDKPGQ